MKTTIDLSKLLTVSVFARKFKISRKKVYLLITDHMLNILIISGVTFIDTSDPAVLDNALVGSPAKSDYTRKKPKTNDNDTFDAQLDRDFEEFERENA